MFQRNFRTYWRSKFQRGGRGDLTVPSPDPVANRGVPWQSRAAKLVMKEVWPRQKDWMQVGP